MYKYTKGATNNKLSSLSNIPPWPGIILPLSFVWACLLNLDSTRSPMVPRKEAINDNQRQVVSSRGFIHYSQVKENRCD